MDPDPDSFGQKSTDPDPNNPGFNTLQFSYSLTGFHEGYFDSFYASMKFYGTTSTNFD